MREVPRTPVFILQMVRSTPSSGKQTAPQVLASKQPPSMNSTTEPIFAGRGQLVCRYVHWVDLVRFLAFNYGLHAVTVLSTPGEGLGSWVINRLLALFLPLVGTFKAVEVIYRCASMQKTPLQVALRAGALCMVYVRIDHCRFNSPRNLLTLTRIESATNRFRRRS